MGKVKGKQGIKGLDPNKWHGGRVGLPNPYSVSKEEFQRRAKKLEEDNAKAKKEWEAKHKKSSK